MGNLIGSNIACLFPVLDFALDHVSKFIIEKLVINICGFAPTFVTMRSLFVTMRFLANCNFKLLNKPMLASFRRVNDFRRNKAFSVFDIVCNIK